MTVENVRTTSLLITMVFACAARPPAPTNAVAPPATRAALEAKPVAWAARDRSAALLPRAPGRVQIVVTPGWSAGEHYGWVIRNGTDVVKVFRCAGTEI